MLRKHVRSSTCTARTLNHPIYEARSRERIMHAVSKILISHSPLFYHARARGRRVGQLEPPAGKTCFNVMYMHVYIHVYIPDGTCLRTWWKSQWCMRAHADCQIINKTFRPSCCGYHLLMFRHRHAVATFRPCESLVNVSHRFSLLWFTICVTGSECYFSKREHE